MSDRLVTSDNSFNSKLLNLLPALFPSQHLLVIDCLFIYMFENRAQRSFVSLVIVTLILLEIFCIFVNGIVCKMHKQVS